MTTNTQPTALTPAVLNAGKPLDPKKAELLTLIASAKQSLEKNDQHNAREALRQINKLAQRDPEAHFEAALIFEALQEFDRAIFSLRKAVELRPNYLEGHALLSGLLVKHATVEQAAVHVRRVFELGADKLVKDSRADLAFREARDKAGVDPSGFRSGPAIHTAVGIDANTAEGKFFAIAVEHQQKKNWAEAEKAYLEVIKLNPQPVGTYINLGNVYFEQKNFPKAAETYSKAIEIDSTCSEAYFNLANANKAQSKFKEAEETFRKGIGAKKENLGLYLALAHLLQEQRKAVQAIDTLKSALEVDPKNDEVHLKLGTLYHEQHQPKQAEEHFKHLMRSKPQNKGEYFNLAQVFFAQKKYEEAIIAFKQSIALDPTYVDAWISLGNLYSQLERLDEAVACFNRVLEMKPDMGYVLNALGNVHFSTRDTDQGKKAFEKAIAIDPNSHVPHWNASLLLLLRGDFIDGWREFEWRLKGNQQGNKKFRTPYWDGSDPKGKKIFVAMEQGFGDCFHMLRYIPLLQERGAIVFVEARNSMRRLLEQMPGVILVNENEEPKEDYDCHLLVMSFPHLFKTTLENIPLNVPYLKPPPDINPIFNFGKKTRPRVGLFWKGNPRQGNDKHRSAKLDCYRNILDIPGIDFFCLQQDLSQAEKNELKKRKHVTFVSTGIKDFADTAHVMNQLDLILTVDTGVCHLTGALGKDVWVMLCHNASWQWLLNRDDSPWYPSMRLFRQDESDVWGPVFERVEKALREKFKIKHVNDSETIEEAAQIIAALLHDGNSVAAAKALPILERKFGNSSEIKFLRGSVALANDKPNEAIEHLAVAIAHNPNRADYLAEMARAYVALKDLELAVTFYQRAITAAPGERLLVLELSKLLVDSKRGHEARELTGCIDLKEADAIDAKLLEARSFLDQKEYDLAEACIKQTLKIHPKSAKIHSALAELQLATGLEEEALQTTSLIINGSPRDKEAYALRARIACALGDVEAANVASAALHLLDPDSVRSQSLIAQCLALKGDLAAAKIGLSAYLMKNPEARELRHLHSWLSLQLKQKTNASSILLEKKVDYREFDENCATECDLFVRADAGRMLFKQKWTENIPLLDRAELFALSGQYSDAANEFANSSALGKRLFIPDVPELIIPWIPALDSSLAEGVAFEASAGVASFLKLVSKRKVEVVEDLEDKSVEPLLNQISKLLLKNQPVGYASVGLKPAKKGSLLLWHPPTGKFDDLSLTRFKKITSEAGLVPKKKSKEVILHSVGQPFDLKQLVPLISSAERVVVPAGSLALIAAALGCKTLVLESQGSHQNWSAWATPETLFPNIKRIQSLAWYDWKETAQKLKEEV